MILVQNCRMIDPASQTDSLRDILIGEDRITKIAEAGTIDPAQITKEKEDELRILNADGLIAAPGLVDTHVHFRDPGAEYKEDILTGAVSAAAWRCDERCADGEHESPCRSGGNAFLCSGKRRKDRHPCLYLR